MRAVTDMSVMIRCIGLLMLVMPAAVAQESAQVKGHFEADRISIGEVVPYSLTARYPRTQQVVFPDSTFSFKPFEFSKKKFFTTRTTGATSYDSVVYFLTTFEIDSIQRLKLPVFVLQEKDCVAFYTTPDSISLNYLVASLPDSVSAEKLPLKTNTAYQKVKWILNYPVVLAGVLALLVASVIVWVVFGKRIRRYFTLRKLNKDYQEFISRFNRSIEKLSTEFSSSKAEEAVVVWKSYMENLEKYPYTKFTSREIVRLVSDGNLDKALHSIDRGIYGGFSSTIEPFKFLQSYSQQRFQKKEAEVKNG